MNSLLAFATSTSNSGSEIINDLEYLRHCAYPTDQELSYQHHQPFQHVTFVPKIKEPATWSKSVC